MTRAPTLAAINAVELRLLQSKRNVRQSVVRTRSALRTAITRPSTVVFLSVAAGFSAFWFARPRRPSIESLPAGAGSAARAARPGIVRTFIARYETQVLAYVLQQVTAAWQKRRSHVHSSKAKARTPPDAANAEDRGLIPGSVHVG